MNLTVTRIRLLVVGLLAITAVVVVNGSSVEANAPAPWVPASLQTLLPAPSDDESDSPCGGITAGPTAETGVNQCSGAIPPGVDPSFSGGPRPGTGDPGNGPTYGPRGPDAPGPGPATPYSPGPGSPSAPKAGPSGDAGDADGPATPGPTAPAPSPGGPAVDPPLTPGAGIPTLTFFTGLLEILFFEIREPETDGEYPGAAPGLDLEIARQYFSGLDLEMYGSTGKRWVHSFWERLVDVTPPGDAPSGGTNPSVLDRLDWRDPFANYDRGLVETAPGSGIWESGPARGERLELILSPHPKWTSAAYVLTFRDGRRHYFDDGGKILAREGKGGVFAIEFQYHPASDDLARVIDSRGQVFEVDSLSAGGRISSVTDPLQNQIVYHYQGELLESVEYPSRKVVENSFSADGAPVISDAAIAPTVSTFTRYEYYDPATTGGQDRLYRILDDDHGIVHEIVYDTVYQSRVTSLFNSQGGEWQFSIDPATGSRIVIDPLGFKSEWMLDSTGRPLELRQYIESTDPTTPSRDSSGYHAWQFTPEPNCDCGLVRSMTSPTGTVRELIRDASTMDLLFDRLYANDQSGDVLEWAYTYDAEGRMASSTTPEGAGKPDDSGYRIDLTYVDLGQSHPVWPGGTQVTLTRQLPDGAEPITWVRLYDVSERVVKVLGPATSASADGFFRCFEYHPATSGDDAGLLKRVYYDRLLTRWVEFDWNAAGRIERGTLNDGTIYEQAYDSFNQLVEIRNATHGSQQYVLSLFYDDEGRSSKSRYTYYADAPDPEGTLTQPDAWVENNAWYGTGGELLASSAQLTPTQHAYRFYGWDEREMLISQVDEEGLEQRIQYDEYGNTWKVWNAWGTSASNLSEYDYNPDGQLASEDAQLDDVRSITTAWSYDRFDRMVAVEFPKRNRTEFDLDLEGRITRMRSFGVTRGEMRQIEYETYEYDAPWTEGPTAVARFVFDHQGHLFLRRIDSDYDYAPSGQLLEVRLEGELYAKFQYRADGLLAKILDADGNQEEFEYDSLGRINLQRTTASDPASGSSKVRELALTLDADGRATSKTYSGAGVPTVVESFGYDSLDNVVRFTSIDGLLTRSYCRYDGLPTLVEYDADPSGAAPPTASETYTWSPSGQIESSTDAGGVDAAGASFSRTVYYQYDANRRLYREVQPNGQYWQWDYNRGDFPTLVTTPTGRTIEFDYNDRGRVVARRIRDASGGLARADRYTWTPLGHLRSVAKTEGGRSATVVFSRDSTGRALSERVDNDSVQYAYDPLGRVTRITAPSGNERYYTYDSKNRVKTVGPSQNGPSIAEFEYLGSTLATTEVTLRGGSRQRTHYDVYGRVESMSVSAPIGSTMLELAYSWNTRNLLEYEYRTHDGAGDVYRYDDLNRLTSFVRGSSDPAAEIGSPGSTAAVLRRDFDLTADGHRTSVSTTDPFGVVSSVSYESGPDRHHYIAVDGVTQVTDSDGRVVSDGSRNYHYDAVDQLIRVEQAGATLSEFIYDALGRLKAVHRDGKTTRYVHAGPWVIEEYATMAGGVEALEAVYTHANGVDDIIMSTRLDRADLDGDGATTDFVDLFHHKNLVGTTQELFLEDGTVVESYRYDAFGAPTFTNSSGQAVQAPPSGNMFLFTGRQYDIATGLYDYRARTYNPATGRFMQEDPLGYVGGLDPISYVAGNPVTMVDPYGTKGLRAAAKDLLDFVKGNGALLASIGIDLLGPLGDIIDVVSGAVGKDIRGYIDGGFKKLRGLSTWKRIKMAAGGAIRALGGAVNLVGKIKRALKKAKDAIAEHRRAKAAAAAQRRQREAGPGCFGAGTAVWLACGFAMPIEEIRLGDVVEVSESHSTEYGLACVPGSPNPLLRLQDESCHWVQVAGRLDSVEAVVEVEFLRPMEWFRERLVVSEDDEVGIWVEFPDVEIRGVITDLEVTQFDRPKEWDEIGMGGAMPVISILRSKSEDLGSLTIQGEEVHVTGGHWIWSETRGRWTEARALLGSEELAAADATRAEVDSAFVALGDSAMVWTLEVAGAQTFCVGDQRVTVHNAASYGGKPRRRKAASIRKEFEEEYGVAWPTEPDGRNWDAAHYKARADGGSDALDNIQPQPHADHMKDHMDKGDFRRWGRRGRKR